MQIGESQDAILKQFARWGEKQDSVRAMILTSTRAIPHVAVDILSDYDMILILRDIHPYVQGRVWLGDFGTVLAVYGDPIRHEDGLETSGYVVQYEDGFKIDFTLLPVQMLQRIAASPTLPDEFDAGYLVVLDKDHLTDDLKPPTYNGFILKPPTEAAFHTAIELFFLDTAYVAKFLWRDDLVAAKYLLDTMLKYEHLLPMLEWHAQIDHAWSIKPGPYGRRLKRRLRPDLWAELEQTYTGAGIVENWDALFATIDLMRRVMVEVGEHLGYTYPHDLETRVMTHLHRVQRLAPDAAEFS